MNRIILRSVLISILACALSVLMCAFFIDDAYAAKKITGRTTKKGQTVKMTLNRGVAIVSVQDSDSWVFSQIQTKGGNKKHGTVGGVSVMAEKGQKATYVTPIMKKGTYYLYLYGKNAGAKYTVKQVKPGGTLKSGKIKRSTSYADDVSVVYYKIKVPGKGTLSINIKDVSYLYPGYSKIRLKKGKKLVSSEEYLIEALGNTTTYGVTKGTYKIGVRSSSELYKIKATFKEQETVKGGKKKKDAYKIKKKTPARRVITPGDSSVRWYKIVIPERSKDYKKARIKVMAKNSNPDIYGGIDFILRYDKKKGDKGAKQKKGYLMNNGSTEFTVKAWKGEKRTVYLKVKGVRGASGLARISWK